MNRGEVFASVKDCSFLRKNLLHAVTLYDPAVARSDFEGCAWYSVQQSWE